MPRLPLALAAALAACSSTPAGAIKIEHGAHTETVTAGRLAELPQVEVRVGDATYAGPRLRDALLAAGVAAAGVDVEAIGAGGDRQVVDAATIAREDVIVALVPPEAGGPLRVVVPGSPGLSVKGLVGLRATAAAAP
ncbi:MAG TPA: molybdopterin-dependent oxidoreductase [Nannocystis sp.]